MNLMRSVSFSKSDNRIVFIFQSNPKIESSLEGLRAYKLSSSKYELRPPRNLSPVLDFLIEYGFEIEVSFEEYLKTSLGLSNASFKAFSNKNSINIPLKNKIAKKLSHELKMVYRDYQLDGIAYMVEKKKVVNGDDVGLGKTCQSIGAVSYLDAFPCLINCPSYLKLNWKVEWEKWTSKKVYVIDETLRYNEIPKADVYIINYEKPCLKTKGYKRLFREDLKKIGFKSAILDESHYFQSTKSKRYISFRNITKDLEYKFWLTGTFSTKSPSSTVSQLKLLGKYNDFIPSNVMGKNKGYWFDERYCNGHFSRYGWENKGASFLKEFHEKLKSICYIRRNQEEVAKDIPKKDFIEIYFDLDNRKEYNQAKTELINYLNEFYDEETAEKAIKAESLVKIAYLRKISVKGKMSSIYNFIDDFLLKTDEKLVVFGVRRESLLQLALHYNSNLLIGKISNKEKQKSINEFQEEVDSRLIFINIVDGITLTAANNILFIEEPIAWKEYQAIGRISRIGQKQRMKVYYSIAKDTLDEDIRETNKHDLKIMDSINKGISVDENVKRISIEEKILNKMIKK